MRLLALLGLLLALTAPVAAVEPDEVLGDPVLEARARVLSKELRCLVCRNESIDGSNATLARDLRILLRERLTAGDTDEEAVQYLVDRYGEYVLLRPRLTRANAVLWFGGAGLLLAGGVVALVFLRRQSRPRRVADGLSAEEEERLSSLMKD